MQPSPTNLPQLAKQQNQRYAALQASINNLRTRLKNFSVVNQLEQMIGRVTDIILDANNRPNLVISTPDTTDGPMMTLSTGLIQNVDIKSRLIQVDTVEQPVPQSNPTGSLEPSIPAVAMGTSPADVAITNALVQHGTNVITGYSDTTIALLAERLKVDYNRRKIGEVVVRKTIETRVVEVPVRYERLIVEQVSPEHKHLADVRLGDDSLPDHLESSPGLDQPPAIMGHPIVSGEFATPGIASQVLNAIARLPHSCQKVRIEIELADPSLVDMYQKWLNSSH